MELKEFLDKYLFMKIDEIDDNEVRNIRIKYFNEFHKAYKDEYGIKDSELYQVYENIKEREKKELEEYFNNLNK